MDQGNASRTRILSRACTQCNNRDDLGCEKLKQFSCSFSITKEDTGQVPVTQEETAHQGLLSFHIGNDSFSFLRSLIETVLYKVGRARLPRKQSIRPSLLQERAAAMHVETVPFITGHRGHFLLEESIFLLHMVRYKDNKDTELLGQYVASAA